MLNPTIPSALYGRLQPPWRYCTGGRTDFQEPRQTAIPSEVNWDRSRTSFPQLTSKSTDFLPLQQPDGPKQGIGEFHVVSNIIIMLLKHANRSEAFMWPIISSCCSNMPTGQKPFPLTMCKHLPDRLYNLLRTFVSVWHHEILEHPRPILRHRLHRTHARPSTFQHSTRWWLGRPDGWILGKHHRGIRQRRSLKLHISNQKRKDHLQIQRLSAQLWYVPED